MKQLVIYPEFPERIRRNCDYDVSVTMDGRTEAIPVYNHTVESNVSRRPGVDMYRRFCMFAFEDGQVRVDIRVKQDFGSYTVFPSAKNFRHEFRDGVISVYLDKPDYFGIQLDDDQNTILSVFADLPESAEQIPSKDDENVVYVEGWYEPEGGTIIFDKPGTVVYIAPGAVFNARIRFTGDGCRLYGRGAIVDPFENIYEYDIQCGGTESHGFNLLTFSCSDFISDGPVLLDARCFNIVFGGSRNTVRNMKALSSMMTTDGVTTGSSDSLVEHCWLYVGDNGVVPSNAVNLTVRDVAIGTTCAAMFPQLSVTNVLFEDINVFRADDGVINNRYNGKTPIDREETITFRRLSAVEQLPASTHLFQGLNMGVLDKKVFFEDVSCVQMKEDLRFDNAQNRLYTDNYQMSFKNLNIDGKPIEDLTQLTVANPFHAKNKAEFEYDGNFRAVERNISNVSYTAPLKVYVGARQVFFEKAPHIADGTIMLPAKEICSVLRKECGVDSEYVSAEVLRAAGYISSVTDKDGTYVLTPIYNGENLLLPDKGEVSYFAENSCYQLDLVTSKDDEGYIYNVLNIKGIWGPGVSRRITDEVKMYGEGTYRLALKAKASVCGKLKLQYTEDKNAVNTVFDVSDEWESYSFELSVGSDAASAAKCLFVLCVEGSAPLPDFSFRDMSLVKVK